jgi:hypothetical protein
MTDAETGDRVSSLAGKYGRITSRQVEEIVARGPEATYQFAKDIRSMAASLRRQDRTKGLRTLWKKVTGQ